MNERTRVTITLRTQDADKLRRLQRIMGEAGYAQPSFAQIVTLLVNDKLKEMDVARVQKRREY